MELKPLLICNPIFISLQFHELFFIRKHLVKYRTDAIITRYWFETTLNLKLRILGPKIEEFPFLGHKLLYNINRSVDRVKNIQAVAYNGYNGARMVIEF
jgi:hypothetical protein